MTNETIVAYRAELKDAMAALKNEDGSFISYSPQVLLDLNDECVSRKVFEGVKELYDQLNHTVEAAWNMDDGIMLLLDLLEEANNEIAALKASALTA